jgi:ABC-type glycerol-3-phosphate transport system substrate-binding protein
VSAFRRSLFSLPALLATFALILGGCGGSKDAAGDEGVVVWHWMSDRDAAFQTLASRYEETTGKKVRFELYAPSESYVQKVRAAAQTGTLPEVFGVLGEPRDFASFVKAGHVENLTSAMEADGNEWLNRFFDKALVNGRFTPDNGYGVPPGLYGVPLDVTNIQMLYNKDLFRKAGLDPEQPPQTWEAFLKTAPAFKKAGIPGFVSGWGELWLVDCFSSNLAFNLMGEEKILKTIRGEIPYTDPDWIKLFGFFEELRNSGLLSPGVVTMINKTAEQNFANGRAAMGFNGSWGVNVYAGMNPGLEYGAFPPPAVSDKHPRVIWGGAGSTLVVNSRSARKADAVAFLKWLTEKDQQVFLAEETKNLPSVRSAVGEVPTVLGQFADDMDLTTHPSRLPVSESGPVIEAFDKGIQSILIQEKTPAQVAAEVQKTKEAEMKKAAR